MGGCRSVASWARREIAGSVGALMTGEIFSAYEGRVVCG